jgi:hypothetical protein
MPQTSLRAIRIAFAVICFFPTTSDEQHVADLDVTALSSGADVDTLIFAALEELFPGNGVVVERVVVDAFFVSVATVVEEDASARNAVLCPVVDGAFVVC